MTINNVLRKITLAGLLAATTVLAQTPYDEGQKALREHRWADAASQFELAIEAKNAQADAAMYWKAYAYYKAGRRNEADRELRKLERTYPESRWIKEAQALRIEYGESPGSIDQVVADGSVMDEEMRLFALSQLMERDPERALPLVLDLMNNASSQQVRTDAMFVLGISEQPAATQALAEAARNTDDPEMQVNAIHTLGMLDASAELQSLYPTLESSEARVAVIEALSIQDSVTVLFQYLESEKDPEVRKAAIHGLAMQGDAASRKFIESMYGSAASNEDKAAILESLILMDDAESLALRLLRTETNPELKHEAIQVLGIMGATGELAELYGNQGDVDTQSSIIEAMMIADDAAGLTNILRQEKSAELRAEAIEGLAIIESEGVSEQLLELYPDASRPEKEAIIEAMMIMENVQGLLRLLEKESDPELKREALELLTEMDSEESEEYLFKMLEQSK